MRTQNKIKRLKKKTNNQMRIKTSAYLGVL